MASCAGHKHQKQISSNLIFTVYQRMAQRKQWAPYMKDVDDFMASFQDLLDQAAKIRHPTSSIADDEATEETFEEDLFFHNVNHIKHIMAAVDPFLERIPEALREQYLLESAAEMFKLKTPTQ